MTPRRVETRIPNQPPVRVYKVIALSFLAITLVLFGIIIFMSSKRATITITTKESATDVELQIPVADVGGSVTTSSVSLSDTFSPSGDTQQDDIATGIITIHNASDIPQPLIATTRFLSEGQVLFRLTSAVTVPAQGTIDANVYADQKGKANDIGPSRFTIPGLNDARQKEVYGTSAAAMTGGVRTVGVVTQQDVDKAVQVLRERAVTQVQNAGTSTTIVSSIGSYTTSTNAVLGQESSSFTVSIVAEVIHASYDATAVGTKAADALKERVVGNTEIVEASSSTPRVDFGSYENGTATLNVFYSGIAGLNPESTELDKTQFFGKSRDEVRRYVLSLDHVQSVDIVFEPMWMQTVPHVADRVNVVIKSVR